MSMSREEFIEQVAEMVAGLQVPVSMGSRFGTAYAPWSRLLTEVNGGFGWTSKEACVETFSEIMNVSTGDHS